MAESDTIETVRMFIVERFLPGEDPARLTVRTPLTSGGIVDSLGVIELVSFLEQRFHIEFESHELDPAHFDTLEAIDALVTRKRGRPGSTG